MKNMSVLTKSIRQFLHQRKNFLGVTNFAYTRNVSHRVKSSNPIVRMSMVGATVGALVGTGYSIRQLNKPKISIPNDNMNVVILRDVPPTEPSRTIRVEGDRSRLFLTLYQYQTCPFCCKVRAFLDYYGVSYNVVEVDPVLRQATKWSTYKKVPILVARVNEGYQPLNDSTMIISALASYLTEERNLTDIVRNYPILKFQDEDGTVKSDIMNKYFIMLNEQTKETRRTEEINEERKWRKWVDDVLVHDLSPNVYRTRTEALQAFNWFSEAGQWEKQFPFWERYLIIYIGAHAMWMIGKRLKKKYNLKDDVRQSLFDDCQKWVRAIRSKGTEFLGGKQPNLADLAVYGVLSSIEGCDAFKDLMNTSSIKSWYFATKNAVNQHKGLPTV